MIYFNQVLFAIVAFISAKEEINATWAFRTYAPPHTKQSKLFHIYGGILIAMFGIVCAFLFGETVIERATLVVQNFFVYWMLFDIFYALMLDNQKWYYLGDEAASDQWLKSLGKNAGKKKALICLILIAITNLIIYFKL